MIYGIHVKTSVFHESPSPFTFYIKLFTWSNSLCGNMTKYLQKDDNREDKIKSRTNEYFSENKLRAFLKQSLIQLTCH